MSNLNSIDWPQLLNKIVQFATSDHARSQIENMKPFEVAEKAKQHSQKIYEAISIIELGQRPFMESLDLYPSWSLRLEKKSFLSTLEFKDIRYFCTEILSLKEILKASSYSWAKEAVENLLDAEDLLSAIEQIITHDGDIRSDASKKLEDLFKKKKSFTPQVQKTLDRIVKDHGIANILQDKYVTTREGRWVLPIKSGMQHNFNGILHASSQSKQTVFMEPHEVVQINNKIRQLDQDIEKEICVLLGKLSEYLHQHHKDLKNSKDILLEFDIILAQSQFSNSVKAKTFQFSKKEVSLRNLKHPLLVMDESKVVPNSIQLNEENHVLILSGPNAGGKTILLKSIGLSAQMARCGLPICAEENSRIPFFKKIIISVGDDQSIDANLSTFEAHLKILQEATNYKNQDSLLLIDEICSSTDPEEGSALARSFIHTYAQNKVFAVVTSHFGNLKISWEKGTGIINGSLDFDPTRGPTYQFFMGVSGKSLALQTAKRIGVDEKIIKQTLDYLSPNQKKIQEDVMEVEEMKSQLDQARRKYIEETEICSKKREKYQNLVAKFDSEKEKMLAQSIKRAEQKIENMIGLSKAQETLKKHSELQKIKMDLPSIISSKSSAEDPVKTTSAKEFAERFPPGSRIYIPSLKRDGVVQGKPNSQDHVEVLSKSIRLLVHWEILQPAKNLVNPTRNIMKKKNVKIFFTHQNETSSVDLRGLSVEEAIEELESRLDKAFMNKRDRIKIIHGHGTEALKKAVRQHLSRCTSVKKWQSGSSQTGGDGVTWAEISN